MSDLFGNHIVGFFHEAVQMLYYYLFSANLSLMEGFPQEVTSVDVDLDIIFQFLMQHKNSSLELT